MMATSNRRTTSNFIFNLSRSCYEGCGQTSDPTIIHRYYNWYIFTKIPIYLGNLHKKYSKLNICGIQVFQVISNRKIQKKWIEMIKLFSYLENIEWAASLWIERKTWAKPHVHH